MTSSSRIEINKFDDQNFELWKIKMKDILIDQEQWIVVNPGAKPTRTSQDYWEKLERKETSTIRLFLSNSMLLNVYGEHSVVNLWMMLGGLYQLKFIVNKLFLQNKLYHLRMEDNGTVQRI